MDRLLARTLAGRGAVGFVEGVPGIGKTALLRYTRDSALALSIRVLVARGSELDQHLAFGGLRDLFFDVLRTDPDLLTGLAAVARPALGFDSPEHPELDASAVAQGVRALLVELAHKRPTVLIVDDLQWFDPASRHVLAYACSRLPELPLGLVIASRPDPGVVRDFGQALRDAQATELRPVPLTLDAIGRLVVAAVRQDEPGERFVAACAEATGGLPFLVTELLDEVARLGLAGRDGDAERIPALTPPGIQRSVLVRLARLSPAAERIARAVAVLPPGSESSLAAAVADVADSEAVATVASLVAANVLRELPGLDFVHPVMRATVAGTLTHGEIVDSHRRAAAVLRARAASVEQVALHLLHTSPRGDDADAATLAAAGSAALNAGAAATAVDYLTRALTEPPPVADRPALTAQLGRALAASGDRRAIDTLTLAHQLAPSARSRAETAIHLAESVAGEQGRFDDAVDILWKVAGELPDDAEERLAVLARLAPYAEYGQRYDTFEWCLAQMPARLVPETAAQRACMVIRAIGTSGFTAEQARDLLIPVVRHPGFISDELPGSITVGWALSGLRAIGELRLALAYAREAVDNTTRWGRPGAVAQRLCHVAGMQWHLGELQQAVTTMDLATTYVSDESTGFDAIRVVSTRIRAAVALGRLDIAAQASATYPDDDDTHPLLVQARGELAAAQGDLERAVAVQLSPRRLAALARLNPADEELGHHAAKWLAALGRVDEARAVIAVIEPLARSFGAPAAIGWVLSAKGVVERDVDLAQEGFDLLDGTEFRFARAEALIDLGMVLRRHRMRHAAREHLRAGLSEARSMQAGLLVARAESELAIAGARSVARPTEGPQALTRSELRIARLAAAGASNREIAQTLFLSVKTVEMHLVHAYRKLAIPNRQGLEHALAANEASSPADADSQFG